MHMDVSQISLSQEHLKLEPKVFIERLKNLKANIASLFYSFRLRSLRTPGSVPAPDRSLGERKRKINFGPLVKLIKPTFFAVIAGVILITVFKTVTKSETSGADIDLSVKGASASQDINREFVIPLKNAENEEVSQIKFFIEKAELRDEIIVKGQKASATEGRIFLIITFKITNEYNQGVEVKTRDYFRLAVNGNEGEWLAPDIHNDPVEVQAISTKPTRLGFPINKTDKNLILRTGEIEGEKQMINLDF